VSDEPVAGVCCVGCFGTKQPVDIMDQLSWLLHHSPGSHSFFSMVFLQLFRSIFGPRHLFPQQFPLENQWQEMYHINLPQLILLLLPLQLRGCFANIVERTTMLWKIATD
jgi:hypothetical protein